MEIKIVWDDVDKEIITGSVDVVGYSKFLINTNQFSSTLNNFKLPVPPANAMYFINLMSLMYYAGCKGKKSIFLDLNDGSGGFFDNNNSDEQEPIKGECCGNCIEEGNGLSFSSI